MVQTGGGPCQETRGKDGLMAASHYSPLLDVFTFHSSVFVSLPFHRVVLVFQ